MNGGIRGPYVLVGHSLGGFHVQLFARQDGGRRVTGEMLVDATPTDFHEVLARRLKWPLSRRPTGPTLRFVQLDVRLGS